MLRYGAFGGNTVLPPARRVRQLLVIYSLPNQTATVVATQSSARMVRANDGCVTASACVCQRQHKTLKGH